MGFGTANTKPTNPRMNRLSLLIIIYHFQQIEDTCYDYHLHRQGSSAVYDGSQVDGHPKQSYRHDNSSSDLPMSLYMKSPTSMMRDFLYSITEGI